MKIFLAMPHFMKRDQSNIDRSVSMYASYIQEPNARIESFLESLGSYTSMFPKRNIELLYLDGVGGSSAARFMQSDEIDITICTVNGDHLMDMVPPLMPKNINHVVVDCDPMHLGFYCHREMIKASKSGKYDYFIYAEDDIALFDVEAFHKLSWFENTFGDGVILQPNRYEKPHPWQKIYVDGDLPPGIYGNYERNAGNIISADYDNKSIDFVKHRNPMSGSFFLTKNQMKKMEGEPSFGSPSKAILSYLETAQIYPLLKRFDVYKPSMKNGSFFEVKHTGLRLSKTRAAAVTVYKSMQ